MELAPVAIVFIAALITAIATGLGALPFALVPNMSKVWLGLSNAVAAGLMISASLSLIAEGIGLGPGRMALGVLVGFVIIRLFHDRLEGRKDLHVGELTGADAKKALMIVAVMTAHSFPEGVGVGVSFGGGSELGAFISTAIALHNVPEGLAISLVLVPRGVSVLMAGWWSIFSSLPQPLMAVPAFLFVTVFAPFLPVGFGLAAGAMLWMTMAELLPEARAELSRATLAAAVLVSIVAMIAFQELVLR